MKKYFVVILCFLLLMISIPIIVVYGDISANKNADEVHSTQDESDKNDTFYIEEICAYVMENVSESASKETKMAVMAICINNYAYNLEHDIENKEHNVSEYSDEYLSELKSIYEELDCNLEYNKEKVFIPLVKHCGEYTTKSDEYPYLKSVASPWEKLRSDYEPEYDYPSGISVFGINYLCENGSDYKSVLRWFLPDFEIS